MNDMTWNDALQARFAPSTPTEFKDQPSLSEAQATTLGHALRIIADDHAVLLCEDTGTGKTYVAAALAKNLLSRGTIDSVAVVGPAHLCGMWRTVLARFGVNASYLSYQRASLGHEPRVQGKALVLVDEAHALKNPTTQRYRTLAPFLKRHALCLITATPISLGFGDLSALLQLCGLPISIRSDSDALRMFAMSLCPRFFGAPLRLNEVTHEVVHRAILFELPTETEAFVDLCLDTPWPVFQNDQMTNSTLIPRILLHRFRSHPHASLLSLKRLLRYYASCLKTGAMRPITRREFTALFGLEGVQLPLPFGLRDDVMPTSDVHTILERTTSQLSRMIALVQTMLSAPDMRVRALLPAIAASSAPVVLFTQYADTAQFVARILASHTATGCITASQATLNGHTIDRDLLQNMFDPDFELPDTWRAAHLPVPHVLVATDTLSAGHNLQRAAILFHLDLPWNPTTVQQREGRILRHHQRAARVELIRLEPRAMPPRLAAIAQSLTARFEARHALQNQWHAPSLITNPTTFMLSESRKMPGLWAKFDGTWLPIHPQFARGAHISRRLSLHAALLRSAHPNASQLRRLVATLAHDRYNPSTTTRLLALERYAEITALWPALNTPLSDDPEAAFAQIDALLNQFADQLPANATVMLAQRAAC